MNELYLLEDARVRGDFLGTPRDFPIYPLRELLNGAECNSEAKQSHDKGEGGDNEEGGSESNYHADFPDLKVVVSVPSTARNIQRSSAEAIAVHPKPLIGDYPDYCRRKSK